VQLNLGLQINALLSSSLETWRAPDVKSLTSLGGKFHVSIGPQGMTTLRSLRVSLCLCGEISLNFGVRAKISKITGGGSGLTTPVGMPRTI
jgi:hypothetical protein